jgi:lysophospholipase L1-like esterase
MKEIFCFGDSITRGEYDVVSGGWAQKCVNHFWTLKLRDGFENASDVYALGVSGETAEEGLLRIEAEFLARRSKNIKPVFVFAYGANDSAFLALEERFVTPKDAFKTALKNMVALAHKYDGEALFVTITPVVEEKNSTPNHRGKVRTNKYVEEYNAVIQEVVEEENVHMADVYPVFKEANLEELFTPDGLHPNSIGHEIIANIVLEEINKLVPKS